MRQIVSSGSFRAILNYFLFRELFHLLCKCELLTLVFRIFGLKWQDMAWTEITFAKAPEYERMVDNVYQMFYKNQGSMHKWSPHLSLAYDNPEDTRLSSAVVPDMISRFPTLTKDRKIEAISLWDTNGPMSDWRCLDRIYLRNN